MSEDLIRRSDAIKAYNEAMGELVKWQMEEWQIGDFSECEFNTTDCKHIVRKIEAIPSADRPQGKWIDRGMRVPSSWVKKCSLCGHETDTWRWCKFCPNCGAKMVNGEGGE